MATGQITVVNSLTAQMLNNVTRQKPQSQKAKKPKSQLSLAVITVADK